MKFSYILLLFCFFSSNAYTPECASFIVKMQVNDKMDAASDASYGEGDDDLFDASEMQLSVSGKYDENVQRLNDYNLTKAFFHTFNSAVPDTIQMVVYFPGLKNGNAADTLATIHEIDFFNGDRSNINNWTKTGAVKDIKVLHNGTLLGCATLQHSYKMQSIELQNAAIIHKRGKADTISIVITSIYAGKALGQGYAISEIKLNGTKHY